MEQVVEVPSLNKVAVENKDLPASTTFTTFSRDNLQNSEDISEDWVAIFLDPSILDEHSSTLPSDFEPYPHPNCTLDQPNLEILSQDLLPKSLLTDSTDDHLSHFDSMFGSSHNLLGQPFVEDGTFGTPEVIHQDEILSNKSNGFDGLVSSNLLPSATFSSSLACPASVGPPSSDSTLSHVEYGTHVACASTCVQVYSSSSPKRSLTHLTSDSNSGLDNDLWKNKEANPMMFVMPKHEEISVGLESSTYPTDVVFGYDHRYPHDINTLQNSSFLLRCEEGGVGTRVVSNEVVSNISSLIKSGNLPGAPPSPPTETFGVRHLQSIGDVIKVDICGNKNKKDEGRKEFENLQSMEHARGESPNCEDHQNDPYNVDKNGEVDDEDDEIRRVWLVRDCASAQPSRQRKKMYVDDLDNRLRTMAATIAELNATISHLTSENVNLRRQLGYYYQPPSICARPIRPMFGSQVLPMRPFSGMVGGRPIYTSPHVPNPRLKTEPLAQNLKKSKFGVNKENRGDKRRAKMKVAGVAFVAIMGLLYMATLLSPFDWDVNGRDRICVHNYSGSYTHIGDVQDGGRVLTSWSAFGSPIDHIGSKAWELGSGWVPLEEGEYGPEREGVPSIHTRVPIEKQNNEVATLHEDAVDPEFVNMSPMPQTSYRNTTHTSTTYGGSQFDSDRLGALRVPIMMKSGMFSANTSESFPASVLPKDNRLVKVNDNLFVETIMASDKATKKIYGKKRKGWLKKVKGVKSYPLALQVVKVVSTKSLDNFSYEKTKQVEGSTNEALVNEETISENKKPPLSNNNTFTPVVRTGSLQQWLLGGLHALKKKSITSGTMEKQPLVDNPTAVAATQGTSDNLSPYAPAPRGPLQSWIFAGLSTELLKPLGNVNGTKKIMPTLSKIEGRFQNLLPPWIRLLPLNHIQQTGKKAHDMGVCSVPTLSKLFWAATMSTQQAKANLQQCHPANKLVVSTRMCTKHFQSNLEATDVVEVVASKSAQGRPAHNVTSKISVPLVPRSFGVPLPQKSSSEREDENNNMTYPKIEKIVRDHMHSQNLRDGASNMVVSILAGPEKYGDNRRTGTKGMPRIFVVVLVDGEKYVTYSCMLPTTERQSHDVISD